MLSIFEIAALLLSLSALFGWVNLRFLKLPHTIGLLIMALASSLLLLGVKNCFPGSASPRRCRRRWGGSTSTARS